MTVLSITAIDNKRWEVQRYLMNRYGCSAAERMAEPLNWYIRTGRASTTFLKAFLEAKTFVVARILAKRENGNYDEIVREIAGRIGC